MTTPYSCEENDNVILIHDDRDKSEGIELWFGHESGVGGWIVIGLADLQKAAQKAGLSLLQAPTGDHARQGRKEPYTARGIRRLPCFRCGNPATFQWSICSDGNIQRPLCAPCDVELNYHVLAWSGDPEALPKLDRYVQTVLKFAATPSTPDHE